ncbi:MAG TPA: biopolymer transporter ExbD [Gemmatimonadaceae bacterium]|jgi:biopolymer transport protein ExbD|nr:biopolymer transporter ExbD [Gemmatimonadaceae bacterium]
MQTTASPEVRTEPNVTPMIDVMLVLLIIFMVVTPLLVTGFRAVPPDAANMKAHPEAPTDHLLGIDDQGRYYLDRQLVPAPLLSQRLRTLFEHTDDRVLFLKADRDLEYSRVLDALAEAGASGFRTVGMIAERRSDGPARTR